jgi:hypothetical protein
VRIDSMPERAALLAALIFRLQSDLRQA